MSESQPPRPPSKGASTLIRDSGPDLCLGAGGLTTQSLVTVVTPRCNHCNHCNHCLPYYYTLDGEGDIYFAYTGPHRRSCNPVDWACGFLLFLSGATAPNKNNRTPVTGVGKINVTPPSKGASTLIRDSGPDLCLGAGGLTTKSLVTVVTPRCNHRF